MARSKNITLRKNALVSLLNDGPQSAADLGLSKFVIDSMVESKHVVQRGTRKHVDADGKPRRGRPVHLFALTDNGRKMAKRHAAAMAKAQAAQDAPVVAEPEAEEVAVAA